MRDEMIVLMYHRIVLPGETAPPAERIYAIEAAEFERHLDAIQESGWEICAPLDFPSEQPGRKLLITFDDSCGSHYTSAFRALARHGMVAIFFVTVGEVGQPGRVTWEQLREMQNAGMSIQSHGFTHRFMTLLNAKELGDEMRRSKEEIQGHLGGEVTMLSFPGGRCNRRVMEAATAEGYKSLFGSDAGVNGDAMPYKRVPTRRGTTARKVASILRNPAMALLPTRVRYAASKLARRIFGERISGLARAAALNTFR
jgi:peptidoglycan/xylan/chitin deacetylase (PgdA/CDA1 family)